MCVEDCNKALELDEKSVKAYYRRAMAFENIKEYLLAHRDYNNVLNIDPRNGAAQEGLQRIRDKGFLPKIVEDKQFLEEAEKFKELSQFYGRPEYTAIEFLKSNRRPEISVKNIQVVETSDTSFVSIIPNGTTASNVTTAPAATTSKCITQTKVRKLIG